MLFQSITKMIRKLLKTTVLCHFYQSVGKYSNVCFMMLCSISFQKITFSLQSSQNSYLVALALIDFFQSIIKFQTPWVSRDWQIKNFDKISHIGLLLKLRQNGISRDIINILDFFHNRKQRAVLNPKFSWTLTVTNISKIYLMISKW